MKEPQVGPPSGIPHLYSLHSTPQLYSHVESISFFFFFREGMLLRESMTARQICTARQEPCSAPLCRCRQSWVGACHSAAGPHAPAGAPRSLAAKQVDHGVPARDGVLQIWWFGKGAKERNNRPFQMRSQTKMVLGTSMPSASLGISQVQES